MPTDTARNHVLVASNWKYAWGQAGSGRALAVAGTSATRGTRFIAFGGTPFNGNFDPANTRLGDLVKRSIAWLTPRSGASNFKVVMAQLPNRQTAYWYPHEENTRAWLATTYAGITLNGVAGTGAASGACNGPKLAGCLAAGADLLIVGRDETGAVPATVRANVQAALDAGIPVLYFHHYREAGGLAALLLQDFGIAAASNADLGAEGLKAYDPASAPLSTGTIRIADAVSFAQRVANGTVTDRATQFDAQAASLRDQLRLLDAANVTMFGRGGYDAEKLLVLLADKLRQGVSYPLADASPAFYRALFSDRAVYMSRGYSSVAQNLGDFSAQFPAGLATVSRTVAATMPANRSLQYATGLYALPGRTVTLRRNDNSAVALTVGLNMLRNTTFSQGQYDRPDQLASARVSIAPGATVTLTSPHGGPIFLFGAQIAGQPSVNVTVSGVSTHPILRNPNDAAEVAAFKSDLDNTLANWVVISTEYLMVHSRLDLMRQSLAGNVPYSGGPSTPYNGNVPLFASDLWTYMAKDTYELAGLKSSNGTDFVLPASVQAFCAANGWDCSSNVHLYTGLQHVVADRPLCGAACSGNPYDQGWPLKPLGWGESHEIGHGLQRSHFDIYDGASGEVSNNIFPMHKMVHYSNVNQLSSSDGDAKTAFNLLVAAQGTANPTQTVYANVWNDNTYTFWEARIQCYRQMVEYARYYNSGFVDGWELFTLLYLMDRQIDASQATWAASAAKFGFGNYAGSFPSSMPGNDFMLIAMSRIIGRDMRPFFDLWGITYSTAAANQVAAFNTAPVARLFFPMKSKVSRNADIGAPVPVAAGAVYPAGY